MKYKTINPTTEDELFTYQQTTNDEIDKILTKAQTSFKSWRNKSFHFRAEKLFKIASILRKNKYVLCNAMAIEMGKPIALGLTEIEKCAVVCEYYAEYSEKILSDKPIKTERTASYVSFQPIGPILAIMPWNFPFWQVFRFVAPNLMLGNSIILKHAPNVSNCSILIENLFREADFSTHVFSNLLISPENVSAIVSNIISDNRISGVTLTGSANAGSFVASLAGKHLKKSVLELGGSDAYIILKDANLNLAVPQCVTSRMNNTGQTCIAAKRFIVDQAIANDFTRLFVEESNKIISGDPLDESVMMGPMARRDLQMNVHNQVLRSIKEGAKLELGGEIPIKKGFFYPPTVLTNIKSNSLVFHEEIFGPVASIITFNNENEAIQLQFLMPVVAAPVMSLMP